MLPSSVDKNVPHVLRTLDVHFVSPAPAALSGWSPTLPWTGSGCMKQTSSSILSVPAQGTDAPSHLQVCYNRYAALLPMVSPLA